MVLKLQSSGSTINRTVSSRFLALIYDPCDIRTFYIQSFSSLLVQDGDSIYLLLQQKYMLKLRKDKIDITYSWFTKIPSYFLLTAVSHYTPINTSVIYTYTHPLLAARMTHHATSQDVPTQTERARTISLGDSLSNYIRPLLIFYVTNILTMSLRSIIHLNLE